MVVKADDLAVTRSAPREGVRRGPRKGQCSRQRMSVRGFTLVEVMIALAVFAVVSAALVKSASFTLLQTDTLRERGIAELIASNRLSELRATPRLDNSFPSVGVDRETVTMAGRQWDLTVTTEATEHEFMRRIDIEVARESEPESVVAQLTGFVGRY
ncbi:MAG: type II secretion system protein GspI [Gammaproteobacteria bacterium]|uniref:Type II secretion system protein I n=1 Tax=OM182 bacterium MED-G24 TaxID=1986255 RepID=A0A2A5WH62_9GAMM|nr:type II secretion system protein GspI [Gammaproteobacteria bacterium]PDH35741.1 MAG: type II secretion system protein GspI [OM182 bacterium MED-G24]RPG26334.1 MAG: type II secretion system protein GspI [Gammaproteobacteria bacterium TMED50]